MPPPNPDLEIATTNTAKHAIDQKKTGDAVITSKPFTALTHSF
jgi:hypothetical protein